MNKNFTFSFLRFQLERRKLRKSDRRDQVKLGASFRCFDLTFLSFRTIPLNENEKRSFIDTLFNIDFDESIDLLSDFVSNILKICAENPSNNTSSHIFDRLVEFFIKLDSKSAE